MVDGMDDRSPTLDAFEAWLGDWTTVGVHPLLRGGEVHGRASFEWGPGRRFVEIRASVDHPDFPDSISLLGPASEDIDAPTGSLVLHWFDSRGVQRIYTVDRVTERSFRLTRDAPEFNQRMTYELDADPGTARATGEMQRPGEEWGDDLSMTLTRS
jgi:hypothetical protein